MPYEDPKEFAKRARGIYDESERAHHPDSPSGLQSSEACPLFENEQRDSLASIAGVLQHKAAEFEDPTLCDTPEQAEAVRDCLNYAHRIGEEKYEAAGEIVVLKEIYLGVGDEKVGAFIGVTGGFPDLVYISEALAIADIFDWKFGKHPVTPTKSNTQGISYALSIFERYRGIHSVTVHFRQPHQGWTEQQHEALYVHTFRRTECVSLVLRVRTIIARKKAARARLDNGSWADAQPKDDLCIYCALKGDCKKLHALVIHSSSKHPDFVVPSVVNPLSLTKAEEVVNAFRWAGQVENIAKAVKDRCRKIVLEDNLELGDSIRIVKKCERQLKNVQQLVAGARRHGVSLKELIPLFSLPFTKVEDLVKSKAVKGQGASTIRSLQADWNENGATELGTPIYFLQEARSPKEKSTPIIEIQS